MSDMSATSQSGEGFSITVGGPLAADPTPAVDWVRAPNCPNNVTDCRITVTVTPVSTPIPTPKFDGTGKAQPVLVTKTVPRGSCSVCLLNWDILKCPPSLAPVKPPPPVPLV